MKASRPFLIFWIGVVVVLFAVEIAEVTRWFTLPIDSVIGNPIAFVFALTFTTILALVGALFAGLYISQRWLTSRDFTPFEIEMLRMREDIAALRRAIEDRERDRSPPRPPGGGP
ncbi:MAG: hypothetical protein QXG65_01090 [Thermoplasmata archaeon]